MRQFATQQTFYEPAGQFAFNAEPAGVDFNQLLMLAIERALAPPLLHRRSVLQPMRIVVVAPDSLTPVHAPSEKPAGVVQVLPRALLPPPDGLNRSSQLRPRIVRGEILSDEQGNFYEKLGRQIRPIAQLASGPCGEVIDVTPAPTEKPRANEAVSTQTIEPLPQSPAQQESTVSHRKLFADPGQWRVVWWGEFKEILARQLAHPERLRDTYRLPCYVQVIETERTVAIEDLAAIYKSDKVQTPLYLLTNEIAAKLDLVLPLRAAPPHDAPRAPNTLLRHERVFRLVAANDPTIDVVASIKNKQPSEMPTTEALPHAQDKPSINVALKQTIPNRFVKEWEFKLSREEVLYDMNAKPTLGSLIRRWCGRLRVVKSRNEFRKWQALLAGRSVDEQLWAVHPPSVTNSVVRNWAERTLVQAGYDAQKMIVEWEIFWRRKGF